MYIENKSSHVRLNGSSLQALKHSIDISKRWWVVNKLAIRYTFLDTVF